MKSKISLLLTLAILAGAGYGAYKYFNKPPKLTFVTSKVTRGDMVASISATGTLAATRSVAVGSRVSGNVVKMYADYNTPVRAGQLLAEIDPSTFQTALDQRRASLDSAKTQRLQAEVAEKRADVDVSNADLSVVNQRAAVARAKSSEVEAKRQYDLQLGLNKEGIVSTDTVTKAKVAWDQAVLSVESAQAQLRQAEATLESTKAQREVTLTQKVTAEAQIKQAQAQLQDAELQLSFTKIQAPVDGVVIARNMNEGQTVQASMSAPQLYEIAEDLTQMHLETNIDESDISRVQLGQDATFTVDAFPGQTFSGEVQQIRKAAVNVQNVISYTVIINVANPDLRLFPGMTANTRIITDRVQSALRVPSAALRFRPPADTPGVVVLGGNQKGKFGKDGFKGGQDAPADTAKDAPKETSKADTKSGDAKSGDVSKADRGSRDTVAQADTGKGRRGFNGNGDFDPSQFQGKGGFDRSQFQGKDRGDFDPSQFQGKGGFDRSQFQGKGGFDRSQFANGGSATGGGRNGGTGGNGGGRNGGGFGGGRGGFGGGVRPQVQTVYRLTAKQELEPLRIRTGITDGNWVQLLGNNLEEGAELVTSIEGLPETATQNKGNQNFNPGGGFPGGGGRGRGGFGF